MLPNCTRALLVGALLAVLIVGSPMRSPVVRANSCWSWSATEKKLARLTNRARTDRGAPRLSLDPELSKVAKVHSKEMARRRTLHHTRSSVLRKRVTRWSRLGENVAYGASARGVQRRFMTSSAHRANILNHRFDHFGVGIRTSGDRLWVTVVFATSPNPGTTLKMPC